MALKRANAKKRKTKNDDQYNFRVGSADKKENFKSRSKRLREEKNITPREIYEAGLKVYENGNTEQQILNRRNKTITERNIFFNLFLDRNIRISGFNRRLRNKNKRYNNYSDEKDVLILFDNDGNELQQIQLTEGDIELKKKIEKEFK